MTVAPLAVMAQKQSLGNGLYWEMNGGVLTISGNGAMKDYNFGGDYVSMPWGDNKTVEKVVIEHGVTSIGACAFHNCNKLTSVSIPKSVTSIGWHAFRRCEKLTSVSIPNSVTSIGGCAFEYCYNLTTVSIPNSVTSIGGDAFWGCEKLTTIHSLPTFVLEGGEAKWRNICLPKEAVYKYIAEHRNEERLRPFVAAADIWKNRGYSSINSTKNGAGTYYIVTKNSHYGLVNATGQEIVPTELDKIEQCGKGFLRFKVNGYWGVMNYTGKIIIPTDRCYTKIGDYVSFTKRFVYEMDGYKGECNNLGVQVSKIKTGSGSTSSNSSTTTSSSKSTASSSNKNSSASGSKTQTVVVEHRRDPVPFQQWQACFACGGMGTMGCDGCGGSGTRYVGDNLRRCSRCNGQGIIPCNICYGNKGQYITVYK